jgi:GNAT superfamily N-acetyltransferase
VLWAELKRQIATHPAKELIAQVREDWPQADFYQSKGFEVYDKMWASSLELETFDPTPFQRPLPQGIQVVTLADLDYPSEPVQRQYYQLMVALLQDVPFNEPLEIWPFELWQERVMKENKLIPEAHFLAFDGENMIGVSQLWKSSRPHTIQTGLTGVLKPYRRQGIAQHLKLLAAQYAKQHGYRYIRTSNHQINRPMLAINEAMGFVKEPAWIHLIKKIGELV